MLYRSDPLPIPPVILRPCKPCGAATEQFVGAPAIPGHKPTMRSMTCSACGRTTGCIIHPSDTTE